jgi:hypothetical protein
MNKPHVHAAIIKAWADGAAIEVFTKYAHFQLDRKWLPVGTHPSWIEDMEYRVKPERVFPETTFTPDAIRRIWNESSPNLDKTWIAVANAVIKQHILDTEKV